MIASVDVADTSPAPTFLIWRLIDELPTETTPPISPLAFAFWKLVEISVPLIVKVEGVLTAEVTDESPIATSPVAVLAVAPRPNANVLFSAALAPAPTAVALTPEAAEPRPIVVAFSAVA